MGTPANLLYWIKKLAGGIVVFLASLSPVMALVGLWIKGKLWV